MKINKSIDIKLSNHMELKIEYSEGRSWEKISIAQKQDKLQHIYTMIPKIGSWICTTWLLCTFAYRGLKTRTRCVYLQSYPFVTYTSCIHNAVSMIVMKEQASVPKITRADCGTFQRYITIYMCYYCALVTT